MASQVDIQALAKSFTGRSAGSRMLSFSRQAWWAIAGIIALIAATLYYVSGRSETAKYLTAKVTRGPIVRTVTATGTLNPVIAVQVGSYVSGPVIGIYADFNSLVKRGQLIAKIDPQPFELKVEGASAGLSNSRTALNKDEADMHYKKLLYERNRGLLKLGAASQNTVDNDLSVYQQALGQIDLDKGLIRQQKAALKDAEVNLNYTNIYSPVDGIIVSRNVDVGQTVAASFQTPTLFLIAKDLTHMQVDCSVSESDIGGVREGEAAIFKVDAFPDRELRGGVAQVRQAPMTVQNVVTYDVVVEVANPELILKPGMTANVSIVTARREDVMRVPVQALRFVPHGLKKKKGSPDSVVDPPDSPPNSPPDSPGDPAADPAPELQPHHAKIWVRHAAGLKPVEVETGLDDGAYVEIVSGDLRPGQKVVIDEVRRPKSKTASTTPQLSS
jgi:HlyD family secretion protein